MKLFIVIVLCGLSVQVLSETETEPSLNQLDENVTPSGNQVCVPNEVKMEDCNRCKCAPNGIGWLCTRKACPVLPTEKVAAAAVDDTAPHTRECEPGTTFKRDCNTCRCTPSGLAACTRKMCIHMPTEDEHTAAKRSVVAAKECEPGTTFKRDCNTCHCSDTGLALCTKMKCVALPVTTDGKPVVKRSSDECEPGTKWNDGCNDCWCTEKAFAICTKKQCVTLPAEGSHVHKRSTNEKQCEPGTKWQEDCNSCFCTPRGFPACTLMRCFKFEDLQDVTDLTKEAEHHNKLTKRSVENRNDPNAPNFSCEPGKTFKHADGCNDCTCAANGKVAACTLKLCVDFKPKIDPYAANFRCTPGTTFTHPGDGCNTCTCKDDGTTAGCTEIACVGSQYERTKRSPVSNDPASPDFSCVPGTQFKHADGCNDCTCADNGKVAACTLKLCPTQPLTQHFVEEPVFTGSPYEEGFSCKPGASFKYECNDCRCLPNGKLAMCTLALCNPENVRTVRAITNTNNPNGPNFRCTAGDQFNHADGCNTCICNTDGVSAACTLRVCLSRVDGTTTVAPEVVAVVPPGQERKCVPGSRFLSEDGCNTCFCTNEGKVGCTLMYCGNKVTQPLGNLNRPIQFPIDKRHKRDTKNKFSKRDKRQFAQDLPSYYMTTAPPFIGFPKPEKKCVPGSQHRPHDGFHDKCICTNEGIFQCNQVLSRPVVSLNKPFELPKRDKRDTNLEDLPNYNTSAEGFKCEPGLRFRDDCNLCSCNADGRAACTDRLCH